MARHAIDFWLSTEDLPRPDNRVTVDRDGKLTLTYTETNLEAKKRLYEKVKSMLGQLDMNPGHLIHRFAYMKNDIPVAGCAHQAGTCRFGTDPETSVLDVNCKAHELDNLYVVDTSVFPLDRGRQPGAHGDGELAPGRRPPARAARLRARSGVSSPVAPSGEQLELSFGEQRAVVVEVGAGLRTYAIGGREVLDGYAADEMCASGRGQVLLPWPNRIEDGSYEFDGRRTSSRSRRWPRETRSTGSSAGRAGRSRSVSRTGSCWSTCSTRSRATRSHWRSASSTRWERTGSRCGRRRRTSGPARARSGAACIRT